MVSRPSPLAHLKRWIFTSQKVMGAGVGNIRARADFITFCWLPENIILISWSYSKTVRAFSSPILTEKLLQSSHLIFLAPQLLPHLRAFQIFQARPVCEAFHNFFLLQILLQRQFWSCQAVRTHGNALKNGQTLLFLLLRDGWLYKLEELSNNFTARWQIKGKHIKLQSQNRNRAHICQFLSV